MARAGHLKNGRQQSSRPSTRKITSLRPKTINRFPWLASNHHLHLLSKLTKILFFGSSLIKSLYRGYLRMPISPCFLHQIVGFNEIVAFTMLLTQPRPKTTWRKQLKKSKPRLLMIEGSAKNYLEIVTSFRYFSNFKPQPPSFSFTWKEFPYLVDKVAVVKP